MKTSKCTQTISAFKFGYVTSTIKHELGASVFHNPSENYLETLNEYLRILFLFKNDYKNIFKEDMPVFPTYRNAADIYDYLSAFFTFSKTKISEIGEAELELAYFAGATLALAYNDNLEIVEMQKFANILKLLFAQPCNVKTEIEIDELISVLLRGDLYDFMEARNTLLEKFIGQHLDAELRKAFHFFDKIVVRRF